MTTTENVPERLIVAALVMSYPPAFRTGGPARSVAAIAEGLSEWLDFRVFTSMDDAGHDLSEDGVVPLQWMQRDAARVFALAKGAKSIVRLHREVNSINADVFYLNSLFHPEYSLPFLVARRFGRSGKAPVVVAPRGELGPEAFAMNGTKKRVVLSILKVTGALNHVTWHATSSSELSHIRTNLGPEAHVVLAPTLRSLPVRQPEERVPGPPLQVVLMSRISRMKNLETAVEVIARHPSAILTVIGPIADPSYWESVLALVEEKDLGDRFIYHGPVEPSAIEDALKHFDVFLLPTRGENFGHVILEALAVGLPVIISDLTPWNDVDADGAGWVRDVGDIDGMVESLEEFENMDSHDRQSMRTRSARVAQEYMCDPAALDANLKLFLDAAGPA